MNGMSLIRARLLSRFCTRCINIGNGVRWKKSERPMRIDVITQEGSTIREVPGIVQKMYDFSLPRSIRETLRHDDENTKRVCLKNTGNRETRIHIETSEGTAILFGSQSDLFRSTDDDDNNNNNNNNNDDDDDDDDLCNGTSESEPKRVGALIENMSTEEINCRVALEALKEIMALESSDAYGRRRRRGGRTTATTGRTESSKSDESSQSSTNGRDRVLSQLMEMISKSRNAEMILEGLSLLQKDRLSLTKNPHRDRLCDETLIRATNGDFTLAQLIESVEILSSHEDSTYQDVLDALWIGIKIREEDIDEDNLSSLFKILPRFVSSRDIVKMILERKLSVNWWRLTGTQMAEILNVSESNSFGSTAASTCTRKWASLRIDTADESELFDLLKSLISVKRTEIPVEKTLAGYMERNGPRIEDPAVVALIMNYCANNRIRNSQILAACEDYLTERAMNLPASLLAPLFVPFGYLNHRPLDAEKFWKTFEAALASKFSFLETNDALNILLSMIYLKRLPVNFVNEAFTPNFLAKLHSKSDGATIGKLRRKLRLLDAAMTIECDRYIRRTVPEVKSEQNIFPRARIKRVTDLIYRPLASLAGGEDRLSKSVIVARLPIIDLYTLDLLIHSSSVNVSIFRLNWTNEESAKTAVLIHLPEHYCRHTTHLIGPQEMRIRHLTKLGFRVMTLNYKILLRLRLRSWKIKDYLVERFRVSQDL